MLIGEYTHTVDSKRRVSLPSKFRSKLGNKVIISRGIDQCLLISRKDDWEKDMKIFSGYLRTKEERNLKRHLYAGGEEIDVDSVGRVLLPERLVDYAGLKEKVILAGIQDGVEIWDEKEWKKQLSGIKADDLVQKMQKEE